MDEDRDLFLLFNEYLIYNQETGILCWKKTTTNRVKIGDEAGNLGRWGYVEVRLRGKLYKAHRIAWFMTYARWPFDYIDHINRNRKDNRISNLRECSKKQNNQNRAKAFKNKSGYKGVWFHAQTGKWRAGIKIDGKRKDLGLHLTKEAASSAYEEAASLYFGEFAPR